MPRLVDAVTHDRDTRGLCELAEDVPGAHVIRDAVARNVGLPQGARIAVTIQVALEAWQGTNVTGNTIGEPLGHKAVALGVPDWATVSAQEYGGRTGMWRLLDTLGELDVPASVSTSTLVAERWPAVAKAVVDAGHEIVGHGYSQDASMSDMDAEEDWRVVSGAVTTFEEVTGSRPYGWSSHGSRRGGWTVDSLLRAGYLYTNDFRDADAPYVVAEEGDRRLVAMPRTDEINDMFLVKRSGNPPSVYVEYFKRAFDQLYREGATHPKVLSCVGHATLLGRPWGASVLAECVEYARGFSDVLFATRVKIARHYLQAVPGPVAATVGGSDR